MLRPLVMGYDALRRPIRLDSDDRRTHMHVIGSSGSGKSKFLEWMMRGDLRNRQGFCLIDPHGTLYNDVAGWCAHRVLDREIVMLNLSRPDYVIGFNPFRQATDASVSVQVDRRIVATMHAWGVDNSDQTPTLERILRLIYTVMIEHNLGLPQIQYLIDFNAQAIRGRLVERLRSALVASEWRELQQLKAKEWREETLSAKNRLFRFLTAPALMRFMGLPEHSINLQGIMDEGKVLLVNLAPSDELSEENARVFGALLVNEFFECARRRQKDPFGRDPKPYFLYMDEFQSFVSLDVADMLDQVRKFGLFTILAHQRFGHLDDNLTDAVLTNCRIKAVFGGLPAQSAKMMAEELFIRKLDPKKIKASIYQTKFWPQEERRQVRTTGTSHSSSSGWSENSSSGSSTGSSSGLFYGPTEWFAVPEQTGTSRASSSESSRSESHGSSGSDTYGESESVADIPVFVPVPFQELSSVAYYTVEEQLLELTAALKEQFPRHCFIKIHSDETQPMLVPKVEAFYTAPKNIQSWRQKALQRFGALPAAEVDLLLEQQEAALLKTVPPARIEPPPESQLVAADDAPASPVTEPASPVIWNRTSPQTQATAATTAASRRKRGPKPDLANHAKVAAIINSYGETWTAEDNLLEVCEALDEQHVPVPKTWALRRDGHAHSWRRGYQHYPQLVIKAIRDRCKATRLPAPDENARQLPLIQ
jgi:hypothetical protein